LNKIRKQKCLKYLLFSSDYTGIWVSYSNKQWNNCSTWHDDDDDDDDDDNVDYIFIMTIINNQEWRLWLGLA
jgi:hypothetical protein